MYTEVADGVSLQCLSTGTRWVHITEANPLYVIYMYGLWISDDGDNDSDGYSNKMFDDGDILNYGDTIVMDEFDKKSGYDAELSAETIRVVNVWMAMVTELYKAAEVCRDGYDDKAPDGFNPVDFAAALFYGSAEDTELSFDQSLFTWSKKAYDDFDGQSIIVNDEVMEGLNQLQSDFQDCKGLSAGERETKGVEMKRAVDELTSVMTVPMIQRFIHHLATEVCINSAVKYFTFLNVPIDNYLFPAKNAVWIDRGRSH